MGTNSEHWRTVCVCTVCGQTPETTPLHKCKIGHVYCSPCYEQMRKKSRVDDQCVCHICGSRDFRTDHHGSDFLKKLRVKPGIGRPYRYKISQTDSVHSYSSFEPYRPTEMEEVTVEQLFQLPKEQLKILFAEHTKQQIRAATNAVVPPRSSRSIASYASIEKKPTLKEISLNRGERSSSSVWLTKVNQKALGSHLSSVLPQSKKPLRCPHDPCGKTVAVSSFLSHFRHEHPQIQRYNVDRGKQLVIPCDASMIEHNVTFCIALIAVYDPSNIKPSPKANSNLTNACNKLNTKVPFNTFWLLVSGSAEEKASSAYAMYWLFTCNSQSYTCTLEMASAKDSTSSSCFCNVNGAQDSQKIEDVAHRLNCLYLTKGTLCALLEDGPDLRLGVTIH